MFQAWTNAMIDVPARASLAYVEAHRIEDTHDRRPVHSAACPFCRVIAVDTRGEASGCPHLKELEHRLSGSYFTFERATVA